MTDNETVVEVAAEETRTVTIIVNTKPHEWRRRRSPSSRWLSSRSRASLRPAGTTVEYSRGHRNDKSLRPGESVRVNERDDLRCRTRQPLLMTR